MRTGSNGTLNLQMHEHCFVDEPIDGLNFKRVRSVRARSAGIEIVSLFHL